jgi:methionine-rich copper-binding protein CopC
MRSHRLVAAGLLSLGLLSVAPGASAQTGAQDVRVMESAPKASAVIEGRSSEFFVRFDRPIDHIHSQLAITRNGQMVEQLTPRLESAPEVLFARAPTLPAGDYDLHWQVKTMTGVAVVQGNIPFTVKP